MTILLYLKKAPDKEHRNFQQPCRWLNSSSDLKKAPDKEHRNS